MLSAITDGQQMDTLASDFEGKRLNSPNDLTITYGANDLFYRSPFGVSDEERALSVSGIYMLREGGRPQLMYKELDTPNGIVLNAKESKIYANDTSSGQIIQFSVAEDGTLQNPINFANVGAASDSGAAGTSA